MRDEVDTGMSENDQRRNWNQQIIEEFRANQGRVGGPFEGVPLVLLHTRGAKSGEERVNPLARLDLDGRVYVFGSNGGRDQDPGWYYNIRADPGVTVEIDERKYDGRAIVLEGPERERVFAAMVKRQPAFGDYATKVTRTIPVVALDES